MSKASETYSLSSTLVWVDRVCDYVPGVSTVTNLIDIFEKCVLSCCCSFNSINANHYFTHINDKSKLRCVVLLIPILGNIIVCFYDLIQNCRADSYKRENQNFKARMVGLNIDQLPQDTFERKQVIESKLQETVQLLTQKEAEALDMQIKGISHVIEKFKKIIDDPEESLEVGMLGIKLGTHNGTHQEKINYFWSSLRLRVGISFLSLGGSDQNETINQKQQEIVKLKKQLLQLRQTSYRKYLQTIGTEDLLKESRKYYLGSFPTKEREGIKSLLEQMTLETILPKLKERVIAQAKHEYDVVEMQEIILQILQIENQTVQ